MDVKIADFWPAQYARLAITLTSSSRELNESADKKALPLVTTRKKAR